MGGDHLAYTAPEHWEPGFDPRGQGGAKYNQGMGQREGGK